MAYSNLQSCLLTLLFLPACGDSAPPGAPAASDDAVAPNPSDSDGPRVHGRPSAFNRRLVAGPGGLGTCTEENAGPLIMDMPVGLQGPHEAWMPTSGIRLAQGGLRVAAVWLQEDLFNRSVWLQMLSPSGEPSGPRVAVASDQPTSGPLDIDVAWDAAGETYVVAWTTVDAVDEEVDVWMARYDGFGQPVGSSARVAGAVDLFGDPLATTSPLFVVPTAKGVGILHYAVEGDSASLRFVPIDAQGTDATALPPRTVISKPLRMSAVLQRGDEVIVAFEGGTYAVLDGESQDRAALFEVALAGDAHSVQFDIVQNDLMLSWLEGASDGQGTAKLWLAGVEGTALLDAGVIDDAVSSPGYGWRRVVAAAGEDGVRMLFPDASPEAWADVRLGLGSFGAWEERDRDPLALTAPPVTEVVHTGEYLLMPHEEGWSSVGPGGVLAEHVLDGIRHEDRGFDRPLLTWYDPQTDGLAMVQKAGVVGGTLEQVIIARDGAATVERLPEAQGSRLERVDGSLVLLSLTAQDQAACAAPDRPTAHRLMIDTLVPGANQWERSTVEDIQVECSSTAIAGFVGTAADGAVLLETWRPAEGRFSVRGVHFGAGLPPTQTLLAERDRPQRYLRAFRGNGADFFLHEEAEYGGRPTAVVTRVHGAPGDRVEQTLALEVGRETAVRAAYHDGEKLVVAYSLMDTGEWRSKLAVVNAKGDLRIQTHELDLGGTNAVPRRISGAPGHHVIALFEDVHGPELFVVNDAGAASEQASIDFAAVARQWRLDGDIVHTGNDLRALLYLADGRLSYVRGRCR